MSKEQIARVLNRCGCDPGWHEKDRRRRVCQNDLAHVYGAENPMVRWLREKHPSTLRTPAMTAVEEDECE